MEPTRAQRSPEGTQVGAAPVPVEDVRAVLALVCGILAWIACPVLAAVAAIVLGSSRSSAVGRAGAPMGWIQLALVALVVVVGLVATLLVPALVEFLRAP